MREQWTPSTIGGCLSAEFSGEWGDAPATGGNATVLRSTDIDNEGHVALRGGARRTIPRSKLLAKRLQLGDVLLEASGGGPEQPVGRVALFDGGEDTYLCSNFFRTLRPNPNVVSPSFLVWRLQHIYAQPSIWVLQQQTTGIINLKYRDYLRTPVQLPPVPEQRRIAEILDTVGEAICKTEQLIAKLTHVKQGLLHDLLTRGIDDNGEVRDPVRHPEQFKKSFTGLVPKSWSLLPLDEIRAEDTPITYGVLKPGDYFAGGIPLLQIQDVIHGELDLQTVHRIPSKLDAAYSRTRVTGGEIVISLVGTIGRIAQLPIGIERANLHRNLGLIRVSERHSSRFLLHALRSAALQQKIKDATIGSTQALLNLSGLRALQLIMPPFAEQERIAAAADCNERRLDSEAAFLQKLHLLKQGLMEDLLTGRVRVTNLPTEAVA